jgi:hypothetical protein
VTASAVTSTSSGVRLLDLGAQSNGPKAEAVRVR